MKVAYLAPRGMEELLTSQLESIEARYGRLFLCKGPEAKAWFAQNVWLEPEIIPFTSVKDAAAKLRERQGLWAYLPHLQHRRGLLIKEQLPYLSEKPKRFPQVLEPVKSQPFPPIGAYCLIDSQRMLASARCSSPFPNGEVFFEENKVDPPSRAYLKLWEALTRIGQGPKPGERCLDLGACPGGWTWVLLQLGADVVAVDRAPLREDLMQHPKLEFRKGNAFSLQPGDFGNIDWLFCDVICYPEKLFEFLQAWLQAERRPRFVCTLKFQGEAHYGIIKSFQEVPGAQLIHLSENKHELTWILHP